MANHPPSPANNMQEMLQYNPLETIRPPRSTIMQEMLQYNPVETIRSPQVHNHARNASI